MYITQVTQFNNSFAFCGDKKNQTIYPRYRQVNPSFDKNNVSQKISQRVAKLPKLMNLMVSAPVEYIEGAVDTVRFSNEYLDMSVPFYKRVRTGEDHKLYSKCYQPEISMIKKITKACNNYINNSTSPTALDKTIENALEKYSNTPIKRKKIFIA